MTGINVNKESFKLKKLKLLAGGGASIESVITTNTDGSIYENELNIKNAVIPHPDLEQKVRSLKDKLLISANFMGIRTIVNSEEFKASAAQKKAVDDYLSILKSKTEVTGIHISGSEETLGVIISGKIQAENGSNIAINSPRMRFTSQVYGFEEELAGVIDEIQEEAYEYLFNNKKAQLEMFDGQD